MAEVARFLRRERGAQRLFDAHRVLVVVNEPQTVGKADAVRVHHDRAGLPEYVAENEIGAFAPDAGERQEIVHIVRHGAAVHLAQPLRLPDEIARLAVVKAAGFYVLLHLADVGLRHGLYGWEARKERGRDEIHARVGTLRGEPYLHKQPPGVPLGERTVRHRVFALERGENAVDLFLCPHGNHLTPILHDAAADDKIRGCFGGEKPI